MELGRSVTTVRVKVVADEQSVTFTLHTDQTTLGDALFEHELIAGEKSVDGLYLMVVNGIIAGYDIDQSCWAFYKNWVWTALQYPMGSIMNLSTPKQRANQKLTYARNKFKTGFRYINVGL